MTVVPAAADVSRETADRLEHLCALVRQWNPAINLVSPATLPDLWDRHVRDSLQLVPLAPPDLRHWADLGSGGGFPGLVVAAALAERSPAARVTLVESDRRKAAFLMQAASRLGLTPTIIADRAERIAPLGADVVSARALAPLVALLPLVRRHLAPGGVALLPKGARHAAELAEARKVFVVDADEAPSMTDAAAVVLTVRGIADA